MLYTFYRPYSLHFDTPDDGDYDLEYQEDDWFLR